jgi:hypothetical protein
MQDFRDRSGVYTTFISFPVISLLPRATWTLYTIYVATLLSAMRAQLTRYVCQQITFLELGASAPRAVTRSVNFMGVGRNGFESVR